MLSSSFDYLAVMRVWVTLIYMQQLKTVFQKHFLCLYGNADSLKSG